MVDATHKAYVYFDLSEVPSTAVVRWAKLRVFLPAVRVKGSGVKVHTVTGEWNEALQSAEPAISATAAATITPDKLATKRFVTVDVTSTVQDWINLKTPNEGFAFVTIPNSNPSLVTAINFASKEGIMGGLPAELDIEFSPEAMVNQESIMVSQLPDALKPLLNAGTFALNDVSQLPLTLRTFLSPSITAQPSLPSFGGSLTVQAQGLGALTYDWKRNGVSVTGGTGAVLSTSGLLGGTYTVTVGNGFSAVTSGPVRVEDSLFALIPAGVFLMGNKDFLDAPEHLVDLSSFYVGRTEVTGDEWRNVLSWALENGYEFGGVGEFKGPNYPITDVNWYDALKWCNAKSEKEGLPPCYYTQPNFTPGTVYRTGQVDLINSMVNWRAGGFRLPTEAEWEKAARGGLSSKLYPTGDTLTALNANINFSVGGTTPVKSYQPNGFGIYDMDGNVNEMCWDFYGPLDAAQATDPHGPSLGSNRVKRGGLWDNDLRYSMSAYRVGHDSPSFAYRSMGFRLFRSAPVEGFPLISAPVLSSTSLTVSAQGASPFSYQWYKDGAPLISGTSSTLSLGSLTSGTYSVMVSNSVGVLFWFSAKSRMDRCV